MTISKLPTPEQDEMRAALERLKRIMPIQAEVAAALLNSLRAAGIDEDHALKLVAHALFRTE